MGTVLLCVKQERRQNRSKVGTCCSKQEHSLPPMLPFKVHGIVSEDVHLVWDAGGKTYMLVCRHCNHAWPDCKCSGYVH